MLIIDNQKNKESINKDFYAIYVIKSDDNTYYLIADGIRYYTVGNSVVLGKFTNRSQPFNILEAIMDLEYKASKEHIDVHYQIPQDMFESKPKSSPVLTKCWQCKYFVSICNMCTHWCKEINNPEMTCAFAERKYND